MLSGVASTYWYRCVMLYATFYIKLIIMENFYFVYGSFMCVHVVTFVVVRSFCDATVAMFV